MQEREYLHNYDYDQVQTQFYNMQNNIETRRITLFINIYSLLSWNKNYYYKRNI